MAVGTSTSCTGLFRHRPFVRPGRPLRGFQGWMPFIPFKSRAAPQPAFSWPSPRGETPFSAALALDSLCSGLRHKEVSPRGGLPGSAPTTTGAWAPISTGVEIHCGSPDLQLTCLGRCSFRHLVPYIYAEADSLD